VSNSRKRSNAIESKGGTWLSRGDTNQQRMAQNLQAQIMNDGGRCQAWRVDRDLSWSNDTQDWPNMASLARLVEGWMSVTPELSSVLPLLPKCFGRTALSRQDCRLGVLSFIIIVIFFFLVVVIVIFIIPLFFFFFFVIVVVLCDTSSTGLLGGLAHL
jgi:hypothetical protein